MFADGVLPHGEILLQALFALTLRAFSSRRGKARRALQRKKCLRRSRRAARRHGNMFARWTGTDETAAPPLATGSHIDAIPNAGKYDGVVGVLGGLEAIRAFNAVGFDQRAPLS